MEPFLNQGAVFSLPVGNQLMILIAGLVLLGCVIALLRSRSWQIRLPLMLIMLGGGVNLYQRIRYSGVLDPFQLGMARFNLADIAIVSGALWLIVVLLTTRSPR